jgi:hypothetical protein
MVRINQTNASQLMAGCSGQNIAGLAAIAVGVGIAAASGPVGWLALPVVWGAAVGAYACVVYNS